MCVCVCVVFVCVCVREDACVFAGARMCTYIYRYICIHNVCVFECVREYVRVCVSGYI